MRWAVHVALMGDKTGAYRNLVGNPERKRQIGRPNSRREDRNKMDL
jgi:hypothetical protein